jgi:hypothetical protein
VQLDPIEAGLAGAAGGLGEEAGQHPGQLADVRQVQVPHALAVAVVEGLQLGGREHGLEQGTVGGAQAVADGGLGGREPGVVPQRLGQPAALAVRDRQVAVEERGRLGAPVHAQEVEELNEQACASRAAGPHGLHEPAEARDEAVVSDAEQGAALDVTDAGGLHHQDARLALREPRVPVQDLGRHEAVLGGPPGHHGRHPGALVDGEPAAEGGRREPQRLGRLRAGRPPHRRQPVTDAAALAGGRAHVSMAGIMARPRSPRSR